MNKKMRDRPYHRAKISHRCAVRTLESIQDILRPDTGTCSWEHIHITKTVLIILYII